MLESPNILKQENLMEDSVALTSTLEDYLETIARLIAAKGRARVGDIAGRLSVHKSTVTTALQGLAQRKLVNYSPYEKATLTPLGRQVADQIVRRHEIVSRFLTQVLAISKDRAEENACRIEHAIDRQVLDQLLRFIEFVEGCPRGGSKWIRGFTYFCEHGCSDRKCDRCIELCLDEFRRDACEKEEQEGEKAAMSAITLDQLKPGERARIVRVGGGGPVNRRIVDMGVVKGTPVEVIKVAPLGDPIEVKLKGYNLSLRRDEAAAITVKRD